MDLDEVLSKTRIFVDELEQYRSPWESKTHWEARKSFLRHNWENFENKTRLECLSQAWANVHFTGNRYSDDVMLQLQEMEKDLDPADKILRDAEIQVMGCTGLSKIKTTAHDTDKLPHRFTAIPFIKENTTERNNEIGNKRKCNPENENTLINPQPNDAKKPKISSPKDKLIEEPPKLDIISQLKSLSEKLRKNLYLLNRPHKKSANEVFKQCLNEVYLPVKYRFEVVGKRLELFNNWKQLNKIKFNVASNTMVCESVLHGVVLSIGFGHNEEKSKNSCLMKLIQLLTGKKSFFKSTVDRVLFKNKKISTEILTNEVKTCGGFDLIVHSFDDELPPALKCSNDKNEANGFEFIIREFEGQNALPVSILTTSADFNKKKIEFVFEIKQNLHVCNVILSGKKVGMASAETKQAAKHSASQDALDKLKSQNPTLMINYKKQHDLDHAISRDTILDKKTESEKISQDNVGSQLLKKMGWSGTGGLGKDGSGISQPIEVDERLTGAGLQAVDKNLISGRDAQAVIRNYASSTNKEVLTFSPDLTKQERAAIHQMASRFGLQSRSFNEGGQRYLVVQHKITANSIIQDLIHSGGQTSGVKLVLPNQ